MLIKNLKDSVFVLTSTAVIIGLFLGGIILLSAGYNPLDAYVYIIEGIFSRPKYISQALIDATPIIMTGLSVAFAFKTGLFNIGAEGQFIVGALAAALAGHFISLPVYLHIPVVITIAGIAGLIWGSIAGFMKSRFGVHEVISTIMLNWIAFHSNNWIVSFPFVKNPSGEKTRLIQDTAGIKILNVWKNSNEGLEWMKNNYVGKWNFPSWFDSANVFADVLKTELNVGIILAVIFLIIIWFVLNKTTLGYNLKAVGFNKYAAEFGGINTGRSIMLSMGIAGMLAGFGGALHVVGNTGYVANLAAMEGYGFNGIAVALMGANSPFGCFFAGLFFSSLKTGSSMLQLKMNAPTEIINIIIGIIVFFVAVPNFIKLIIANIKKRIFKGRSANAK